MSIQRDVRAAIQTLIEGAPGTSNVHAFERFDKNRQHLLKFYQNQDGSIHGWFIQRTARREKEYQPEISLWLEQDWLIRHFQGLEDAEESELGFDDMLDAVIEAHRQDRTMGGTVALVHKSDKHRMQLIESGPVTLCGALCHGARITLTTSNYIDLTAPYQGTALTGGKYSVTPDVGPPHVDDYKDLTDGN